MEYVQIDDYVARYCFVPLSERYQFPEWSLSYKMFDNLQLAVRKYQVENRLEDDNAEDL